MERPPPLPPPIADAGELLTLAQALETEAARRYRDLARRMQARGDAALAELFSFLAGLEDKHAEQVAERGAGLGAPPDPARVAWEVPESFDEEAARSAMLTPYTALAIAVRNEERAFAFYCHAAAVAPGAVAALAEDLARDELDHAARLRHARRAAWRVEGRPPQPALPADAMELQRDVAARQHSMASGLLGLARQLQRQGEQVLGGAFERIAREADPQAEPAGPSPDTATALRVLEQEFELLSDIAARTQDEAVLAVAQGAAQRVVGWLALAGGSRNNQLLRGGSRRLS